MKKGKCPHSRVYRDRGPQTRRVLVWDIFDDGSRKVIEMAAKVVWEICKRCGKHQEIKFRKGVGQSTGFPQLIHKGQIRLVRPEAERGPPSFPPWEKMRSFAIDSVGADRRYRSATQGQRLCSPVPLIRGGHTLLLSCIGAHTFKTPFSGIEPLFE